MTIDVSLRTDSIGSNEPRSTLLQASIVYFGQCLQAALLYRSSLAIFLVAEAFSYAGFVAFWYKAAQSNPAQKIYSPTGLVVYFILVSFHHSIQHHAASRDLGSDIRLGKLSYAIIRPFPFLLQTALRSVAFTFIYATLLSPLLAGAFLFVPGIWESLVAGFNSDLYWHYTVAITVGLTAGWFVRMLVGMLAFDMAQIWGPDTFFIALYYAGSGAVFPIDLLPVWALNIVKWTPMYYMVGFPVLTLMGRIPADTFWLEATRGMLVTLMTFVAMYALWRRGIKKFEAIGI